MRKTQCYVDANKLFKFLSSPYSLLRLPIGTMLAMCLATLIAPAQAQLADLSSEPIARYAAEQASWRVKPNFSKILRQVHHRHDQSQYEVLLALTVDKKGSVSSIKVLRSSGHDELDRLTMRELKRAEFYPFKQNGKAVIGQVNIPIIYKIEKDIDDGIESDSQSSTCNDTPLT